MRFDPPFSASASCDERGVPRVGRRRELSALREAGARDLAFGRLYEGHVNALQLIARCGTPLQAAQATRDAAADLLFGVWNSQDGDPVRIESHGANFVLFGSKTWCSGAGHAMRPIVTARRADGASQMCIVPMERVAVRIDPSTWQPLGMKNSDSFQVSFDGVVLAAGDLLGEPGAYERAPWFLGGAIRFVAVQTGGIDRLVDETIAYLIERGRADDPLQQARVADMQIARWSARNWLDAGADVWAAFDATPSLENAERATYVTDMARASIERHALAVIGDAERCVGARGLLEPLPFARLVRDLQMYLRQPAPDASLLRVASTAFSAAISARRAASASATGTAE